LKVGDPFGMNVKMSFLIRSDEFANAKEKGVQCDTARTFSSTCKDFSIHRFGEIVTTCNKDLAANFFSSIKEIINVVQSSSFQVLKRSGFKTPSPIVRLLVEASMDQNLWYNWADQV
jgi:hypothetical protein